VSYFSFVRRSLRTTKHSISDTWYLCPFKCGNILNLFIGTQLNMVAELEPMIPASLRRLLVHLILFWSDRFSGDMKRLKLPSAIRQPETTVSIINKYR
jgi:hypothetical protein